MTLSEALAIVLPIAGSGLGSAWLFVREAHQENLRRDAAAKAGIAKLQQENKLLKAQIAQVIREVRVNTQQTEKVRRAVLRIPAAGAGEGTGDDPPSQNFKDTLY